MGYVRQRKVYRLVFADEDMQGLVVRARSAPVGQFMGLAKLAGMSAEAIKADGVGAVDELFRSFAGCLVGWNLEDEGGTPVPATLEGLYTQDVDFVLQIIAAWVEGIAGVSGPLGASSSDGGRLVERSLPMEALLPNRQSSPTPSSS